jgi:hypothetical protein
MFERLCLVAFVSLKRKSWINGSNYEGDDRIEASLKRRIRKEEKAQIEEILMVRRAHRVKVNKYPCILSVLQFLMRVDINQYWTF